MRLGSQMLREDPALQACLVSDAAHVVPGAVGPHVSKIQSALLLLDRHRRLPSNELKAGRYGPETAAAVLALKIKHGIVNRSYQTQPDNIVGRMTIAFLDSAILAIERRGTPGRAVCCGTSGRIFGPVAGEGVSDEPATLASLVARKTPPRAPLKTFQTARISVVFQETDAAVEVGGSVSLLFGHFQKARQMMAPFGIDFAGAGDNGIFPLIGPRIPDFSQVIAGSPASTFSVRAAAERVFPGQPEVLRVIYCPFNEKDDRTFGITDGGIVSDWDFPKFCMINVRKANPDQGTMLHEMIHASRLEKREHDLDPSSVFSENIGARSRLTLEHAEALAHAFFAAVLR